MSLTTYIQQDLAARLRSQEGLPEELTLDALADFYQVSFTPVRAAVAEVIREGLLEKKPNGRLAARALPRGERARAIELPEPPTDVYESVARELVELSLQGEAVVLREEATAERFGISRSSMRNIFHRLAGTGLVDHLPRRGWRLRPFRREDLQAFNEVREVLEVKALELAYPRLDQARLRQIHDGNRPAEARGGRPVVDNSLHQVFIDTAANPYIVDFFRRHGPFFSMLFGWEARDRKTTAETVQQHCAILSALLDADLPAARDALSHHIRANHPILETLGRPQSPPQAHR